VNQPPEAGGPTPLLVLDVVGLTPRLLDHMPHLKALGQSGSRAHLGTVLPAVTCAAQSTFLTGTHPAEHGIVGNGWYFRELGDVLLWRQHNGLVSGDKLWDAARRAHPGYTVANICWWYAMGADTDITITPRPIYYADGRKEPDCYTRPPALHDELTEKFGTFPLFHFWGPGADLVSSRWIIDATRHILRTRHPDLALCYLPHLDYDLQRFGPDDPRSLQAAADLDAAMAPLLDEARAEGRTVVALSEYGITRADRPVDINRALRRAGLLRCIHRTAWSTSTRWPHVPSPSPTTRSPTSTYAGPKTSTPPERHSPTCPVSSNSSTTRARRPTISTIRAPANSSP
jgi:predicted AlkP superfamily pyrophosphatase or phosphodiesterase